MSSFTRSRVRDGSHRVTKLKKKRLRVALITPRFVYFIIIFGGDNKTTDEC